MTAWMLLEPVLLTAILLACGWVALRRLAPAACRRARVACALVLLRRQGVLRQLGRRLAPVPAHAAARPPGCGPCGGCEKGRA